ncbi:hypothetical protein Tco_0509734 [Tanacetum coccineum]
MGSWSSPYRKAYSGALVAPLVPASVAQLLRVLINFPEPSTLVVRFVLVLDTGSGEEWSPQDDWDQIIFIHFQNHDDEREDELVYFYRQIPNHRKRECGIRLILAPKSANSFFTFKSVLNKDNGRVNRRGVSPSFLGLCSLNEREDPLEPWLLLEYVSWPLRKVD